MSSLTFKVVKVMNGFTVEDRSSTSLNVYVAEDLDGVRKILDEKFLSLGETPSKKYTFKKSAPSVTFDDFEDLG